MKWTYGLIPLFILVLCTLSCDYNARMSINIGDHVLLL